MLLESTEEACFKSVYSTIIPVDVHECNLRFVKQESQLLLGWADRTVYTRKPASDFSDCCPIHAMVTLLYRMHS